MAPPLDYNLKNLLEKNSCQSYSRGVAILLKLLENIIKEPQNVKYRSFRLENPTIKRDLLSLEGIEPILSAIGFQKTETNFCLPEKANIVVVSQWKSVLESNDHESIKENLPTTSEDTNKIQKTIACSKPYLTKIMLPRVLKTTNNFLQTIEFYSDCIMQYEDELLLASGRSMIPIDSLTNKASEKLCSIQKKIEESKDIKEPCIRDLLLVELLNWFNNDFFAWVNNIPCKVCGREDYQSRRQTIENNIKIEIGYCCGTETRFSRYNDIADLLKSRKGRCGEFANCFTFLCRCLDYDARLVHSQFDHVWTEVYSENQKRWLHLDPSDNIIDSPLIYQHGWKREIDYVFGFSKDNIQDVTWRYTSNHQMTKALRNKCSEADLTKCLMEIRNKRQKNLSDIAKKQQAYITVAELIELTLERAPNEDELKGRSSGSLAWKLDRGESKYENVQIFEANSEEVELKQFNLRYSCTSDVYERYTKDSNNVVKVLERFETWQKGQFSSKNMFRKVERDWKMVYLAREENSSHAEITWKFDFSKENLVIKSYSLVFDKKTYENGEIIVEVKNSSGGLNPIGSSGLTITAKLTGGQGDCAWQHTQLFRQNLSSTEFPFNLCLVFK